VADASPPQGFTSDELGRIDGVFAKLPAAHLLPPHGLRQLRRGRCLARGDRAFPSVMAEFSAHDRGAYFFDAAFVKPAGGAADPVSLVAHALIGCSLATNAILYRAFARRLARSDASPASVMLLDQGVVGGLPTVDLRSLPPGVDLGIAYALFVNHPAALAAAAPDVFSLLEQQLFAAESTANPGVGDTVSVGQLIRG
jgi:hypothetical protein